MTKLPRHLIVELLLATCVNERGDLDLSHLDFSDFDGNVILNGMKVKKNLYQHYQTVGGDIHQYGSLFNGKMYTQFDEPLVENRGYLYETFEGNNNYDREEFKIKRARPIIERFGKKQNKEETK